VHTFFSICYCGKNAFYKKQLAKKGYNVTWDGLHNEIISNPDIQKIAFLKGKHYLQWSQSQAIADMTDDFLSELSRQNR